MMTKPESFLRFAEAHGMFPRGCSVLCAVSGGADSMALLTILDAMEKEGGIRLCAAHFEHGLRGEEALRDAAFVKTQCRMRGIPCVVGHGDVRNYADEKHLGLEEAARLLRYRFLSETADRLDCGRIATAHTADDNAETLVMNLIRGSGTRGLAGIPPVRGRLVRPLLQTSREEILSFLRENGVPYVEDSSNRELLFTRNRVRSQIIPLLKEENPSFLRAAARTAELLRGDERFLCGLAEDFLRENLVTTEKGRCLPSKKLQLLEVPVAARVLRLLCGSGLSMERTEALLRFAKGTEKGVLELPGRCVRREKGMLIFPADEENAEG